jgi:iron complex outermembrane receptor protein
MKRAHYAGSAVALLAALGLLPSAAFAQGTNQPTSSSGQQLEEIIVTATKTGATQLQSTPLAVTAFTAAQLDQRKIDDVRGLVEFTPGLQISDINGYAQLYIRGVGSNTVYIGSDPSVTVHLDGVYLARPLSYFSDFLDVERVEVLRGPQGTLYGRNSVGGTINIISKKPSETFTGELQASVGTYDEYSFKGYVSGPINGTPLRFSLAGERLSHDPYFDNISTAGGIVNQDSYALRGQIYLPLGDRFEATFRADYTSSDEAIGGASKLLQPIGVPSDDAILGDYFKIAANSSDALRLENFGFALDMKYELSDAVTLKSLTAYRSLISSEYTDSDASSTDTTRAIFDLGQHQVSEELNLTADLDPLKLVGGFYYFAENDREPADVILPSFPPAGFTHFQRPTLRDESYAFFAQGEYKFNDQWSAIMGLRWTRDSKHYAITDFWTFAGTPNPAVNILAPKLVGIPGFSDPFSIAADKGAQAFTPKFGVNYEVTDDVLAYASITRGFKTGGFDFGSSGPIQQATGYGPEFLWSYELGLKSQWFQNRLRVNLDAFYYDYSDLQVELFTPPANAFTQNAASASVKGIEAEIAGRPLPSIDLYANIAYLDAQYDDYPEAQAKFGGVAVPFDASGKYLNDAPKWSLTLGGTYTYDMASAGDVYLGIDFHFQTTQFFSPVNDGVNGISGYPAKQGSFGLLNMRLGWDSEDRLWNAVMIARNLTNRQYITTAANYGGPALSTVVGRPGDPQTFVFQVSRKF